MKVSATMSGTYLKGSDLQGRRVRIQIDRIEVENVGGDRDPENKPVIYFIGKQKGMTCNKTNMNELILAFGDDDLPCPTWHGKLIEVYFDPSISYAGKRVGGLRLSIPTNGQAHQQQAPTRHAPAPVTNEFVDAPDGTPGDAAIDDEVPWA